MLKRIAVLGYGALCYALFFATFVYAVGFIGNLWVPVTLDGPVDVPLGQALATNVLLLGLFAVQHSLMARPGFKRWWTRYVPQPVERSTYVLFSSVLLIVLFAFWEPMGGMVWSVSDPLLRGLIHGLYGLGWALVLVSSFQINHFDLFGLRQVWLYFRGRPYSHLPFKTPWLYRHVRHPLYVGWFLAFWATPTMSLAHLLFALLTSAYILIAIRLEERDLVGFHPEYRGYRQRVPMLIPRLNRRPATAALADRGE
ncbi:methanethiol S-methyltransferase [Thiohalobacter thiocyanaticus]|uniref:methanethiol S-methyltransferase n=1 Tax=Thiohalobacter thiocyanaticus TaxID=585455 RepID=A0A426QID1_9GAMM|nr:methanethiol S-methyltransferase [Thiohalobacter thiocyanaticus]RRQ21500.1 isoprenylcysteine carboxylmethyltransferase family protein [Thiohalobacter thiocyanaticus]